MSGEVNMTTKEMVRSNTKVRVEPPKSYNVFVLNDDETPMDLVVAILVHVFHKDVNKAISIMLEADKSGSAFVGEYTYDIANTRVRKAKGLSNMNGYDLNFRIEEA